MAFQCAGGCKKQQGPGTRPIRLVTVQRLVTYRFMRKGVEVRSPVIGRETVAEGDFCPPCVSVLPKQPRIVEDVVREVKYEKNSIR
ncbi:MAG TPA: hypothetical protein VJH70_02490 [Candidatus Paceibacterota bacterium]